MKPRTQIPYEVAEKSEPHHAKAKERSYSFRPGETLTPKEAQGVLTGEIPQGPSMRPARKAKT